MTAFFLRSCLCAPTTNGRSWHIGAGRCCTARVRKRDKAVIRGVRHAIHHETDSGHCRRHRRGGRVAVVSSVETVEKLRGDTEFVSAQVLPGSMKTKSSCEKGRDLGQHCVEAQVDDGLMSWRYLMGLRKRALIRSIPIRSVHDACGKFFSARKRSVFLRSYLSVRPKTDTRLRCKEAPPFIDDVNH